MAELHHLSRPEGRARAADLLKRFDLVEAGSKILSTYSGGMRRRLDLPMTLIGDPRIIFLDQPTTRLHPRHPHTMRPITPAPPPGERTNHPTPQYPEATHHPP